MKTLFHALRTSWILPLLFAISLPAYAVDGQIKIAQTASTTFPIVIDQSGSYVLTSNIRSQSDVNDAIDIRANEVTLDLNGHSIVGPGSSVVQTARGIRGGNTIMNGYVSGFHTGIQLLQGTVVNCDVHGNGQGITVYSGSRIIGNTVHHNSLGAIHLDGENNYVIKNVAFRNGGSNFTPADPTNNYMPTDLSAPDAANANVGW